jgi:hypothetical protein
MIGGSDKSAIVSNAFKLGAGIKKLQTHIKVPLASSYPVAPVLRLRSCFKIWMTADFRMKAATIERYLPLGFSIV